jgi:hypothetical protein
MVFGEGGTDDLAVYRPSNNYLYILPDTGQCSAFAPATELAGDGRQVCTVKFGIAGDTILTGDVDGDGRDDVIAFRPSLGTWYFKTTTGQCPGNGTCVQSWGLNGDIPLVAHFSGKDSPAAIAVYRPSEGLWYLPSTTGTCPGAFQNLGPGHDNLTYCGRQFGLGGADIPVVNDWDGDGLADIGVWRVTDGNWHVLPSTGNNPGPFLFAFPMADGWIAYYRQWGLPGDIPISGAR